jgi:hypothetical protein
VADVFISYAREDCLAAQKIAETLKRHGRPVWLDSDIPPQKTWDEMIERELGSASCVVVLWSATSLAKSWVKAEAAEALGNGTCPGQVCPINYTPHNLIREVARKGRRAPLPQGGCVRRRHLGKPEPLRVRRGLFYLIYAAKSGCSSMG